MTPHEIRIKSFRRGIGGYRVKDVRAFLGRIAHDVGDLTEKLSYMQRELEMLEKKVKEYRENEDHVHAAFIRIQRHRDNILREAQEKAKAMLEDAARQAIDIRGEASKFREQMLSLYEQHINLIQCIPRQELQAPEIPMSVSDISQISLDAEAERGSRGSHCSPQTSQA